MYVGEGGKESGGSEKGRFVCIVSAHTYIVTVCLSSSLHTLRNIIFSGGKPSCSVHMHTHPAPGTRRRARGHSEGRGHSPSPTSCTRPPPVPPCGG